MLTYRNLELRPSHCPNVSLSLALSLSLSLASSSRVPEHVQTKTNQHSRVLFPLVFNHRSFQNRPFSLGFLWVFGKKDPWKGWGGYPQKHDQSLRFEPKTTGNDRPWRGSSASLWHFLGKLMASKCGSFQGMVLAGYVSNMGGKNQKAKLAGVLLGFLPNQPGTSPNMHCNPNCRHRYAPFSLSSGFPRTPLHTHGCGRLFRGHGV